MQVIREVTVRTSRADRITGIGPVAPGFRAQLCREDDDPDAPHYVRILDIGGDPLVVTAGHIEAADAVAEIERLRLALGGLALDDLLGSPDASDP